MTPGTTDSLETQIAQWRAYLNRRQAIRPQDVSELEDHLRDQVATLRDGGLAEDEAFLVAVKRMGALDAISNEFAREHSDRLWKQLVMAPGDSPSSSMGPDKETFVVFGLAIAAAMLLQAGRFLGLDWNEKEMHFWRNATFFVLPLLTAYFVWKRKLGMGMGVALAGAFAMAAVFANLYTFPPKSHTMALLVMHLPIALWLLVGLAYAGRRWREVEGRMDFVRFSGELAIYYALIALGGGVFTAITIGLFEAIGLKAEVFVQNWMLPSGIVGAVIVAAWLVEAKKSVIENMAPVLTRLFVPLFALLLLGFLGTMAVTGRGIDVSRNALIAFDVLLAFVLALLLYSISAREREAPPAAFDGLLVLLLGSALLADAFALAAIAARISEFGFTANRMAVLGFNLILLVNLAWSLALYVRFLRGRGTFAPLERWQTAYLPVYSIWAALVVIVFPPLFGYL